MHLTLDAFSDSAALRDNALTRVDARVKLALALAGIVAVLLSARLLLPLAIFTACMVALPMLRIPRRTLIVRLAGPIAVAAMICFLRAAFSGSTVVAHLPMGPWRITFTREGLQGGLLIGSHVLASVSVLVLLGSVTPAYKVFAAMRWARMPRTLVELAMLMYRYIFSLLEEIGNVRGAQRVRLGYVNFRKSLSSTGELMGVVMLRAVDQAQRTHEAMTARGYAHRLPIAVPPPLRAGELLTLAAGLAILAAAFTLCQAGPI